MAMATDGGSWRRMLALTEPNHLSAQHGRGTLARPVIVAYLSPRVGPSRHDAGATGRQALELRLFSGARSSPPAAVHPVRQRCGVLSSPASSVLDLARAGPLALQSLIFGISTAPLDASNPSPHQLLLKTPPSPPRIQSSPESNPPAFHTWETTWAH